MKKVLSVALASAMVLGMGVNAFADISYNTGAGTNEVSLEEVGLDFGGKLVIDRADVNDVSLGATEDEEFRPGDVIYMPLYGDDQLSYDVVGDNQGQEALPAVTKTFTVKPYVAGKGYEVNTFSSVYVTAAGDGLWDGVNTAGMSTINYDGHVRTIVDVELNAAKDAVTITLKAEKAVAGSNGSAAADDVLTWGPYTGEIGKNWSINFVEKSENYVEKASFYRAKASDKDLLNPNAWYIKVELKDLFDSVDSDEVYYKVYVTDNNDRSETSRVYVKGTLDNDRVKYVDFEWTNNANTPAVWQVKKGENGTAVFDFEDKAFFTVKMYSEEKMYLDLSTAYQKAVAGEYDAEFDNFFKFQGTNANFSRTGELIIESNDPNLFVYEIDSDNNLYPVDAKYVKDYQITHTNDKINGYVFNTKTLGNYVLSVDELEVEEDEAPATEAPEEKPAADKENPNTGANDFVGVAVALAVVSVAGAGALALKK